MPTRATLAALLRRLFAAGSAALVFALTVFAASPALHDHLHCATHTAHDEFCPVVLLAVSADVPSADVSAPVPFLTSRTFAPATPRELFLSPPRYLRQPERGPPSGLIG